MINRNLKKLISSDDGDKFEEFCQAFCLRKYGATFRPIGGKKDGGRDGILYINPQKEFRIYQFSIDEKPIKKIERTFDRLKEFLAEKYAKMTEFVYITNQTIKDCEAVEDTMERTYGKRVKVHDLNWLFSSLSSDDKTLEVAMTYHLEEREPLSPITIHPEVYLFFSLMAGDGEGMIDHSLDIRSRALDALILQELGGTSSEKTMLREQLISALTRKHQWIRTKIIDTALKRLNEKHSKKTHVRLINWHKKEDALCLPHDTVLEINERRNEAVDICDFVESRLKEYIGETAVKARESERTWPVFQEYLAKVFKKRGAQLIDWAETANYSLCPADLELLSETLNDRGIRDHSLHKAYQYAINRLLGNGDKRVAIFMARLNEAYLLHLVAGRDLKVHAVLERMRSSLTVVCCSSVVVPQMLDFLRTGTSLLKRASDAGVKVLITDKYIDEVKTHLRDSLRFDADPTSSLNEVISYAVSSGKKVSEVLEELGLQVPDLGNIFLALHVLFGMERAPSIDIGSPRVVKLANSLKPLRDQSFAKSVADASVFYYIRNEQGKSRGHYTTWWLTRETATVKVAQELRIDCDKHVYMRLSFLQDMLLLMPGREEIEDAMTPTWAMDALLLSTPADTLPSDLLTPYRKAKKQYETSNPAVNHIRTVARMNAFMAIGKLEDRTSPG